jgi:hypothetical protein
MIAILEILTALAILFLLYLGIAKLVGRIRCWLFPTQHELELRLEKTLAKEEELERKRELKENLISATKRVKVLEKEDAKADVELNKVCN